MTNEQANELLEAVDEIPVCDDGQEAVKTLVRKLAAALGQPFPVVYHRPQRGDRYRSSSGSEYIVTSCANDAASYLLVSLYDGSRLEGPCPMADIEKALHVIEACKIDRNEK